RQCTAPLLLLYQHHMEKTEVANERHLWALLRANILNNDTKAVLIQYLQLRTGANTFSVEYCYGKDAISGISGLYAVNGVGLQMLRKDIRNYLSSEFYHDVDIQNCLPQIFFYLFDKCKISCLHLDTYIRECPRILEEQSLDKKQVISMIFDEKPEITDKFFKDIHDKVHNNLIPKLKTNDCYLQIWNNTKVDTKNRNRCFLARVVFDIENDILLTMNQFFEQKKWSLAVLVFEGVMI
ncbi:hypothetical protein HK100_008467, partial [Physocladia obscura]